MSQMRARTPHAKLIMSMLAEGPRRKEEVIQAAMPLIQPGKAFRRGEEHRNRAYAQPRKTPRKMSTRQERGPGDIRAINYGARDIVVGNISTSIAKGRLIEFEQDGEKWLKLP